MLLFFFFFSSLLQNIKKKKNSTLVVIWLGDVANRSIDQLLNTCVYIRLHCAWLLPSALSLSLSLSIISASNQISGNEDHFYWLSLCAYINSQSNLQSILCYYVMLCCCVNISMYIAVDTTTMTRRAVNPSSAFKKAKHVKQEGDVAVIMIISNVRQLVGYSICFLCRMMRTSVEFCLAKLDQQSW